MDLWTSLKGRLGLGQPEPAWAGANSAAEIDNEREGRDPKRLFLLVGLGALSWVATYVGMLELIESNLGDLPFVHKVIIAFSVAMLMVMIIWLLDKMFAPVDAFTRNRRLAYLPLPNRRNVSLDRCFARLLLENEQGRKG